MTLPPTGRLLAEWQAARAELTRLETAEHPPVTDHHGRVWTWIQGDLYGHCGMAWPLHSIQDTRHQLPGDAVRSNPNYDLCDTCKGEQTNAG